MLRIDRDRFGANLRQTRESRALSVYALAKACGIQISNYQRWERGTGLPELRALAALCLALDCTVEDLLRGAVVMEEDGPEDGPGRAA